MDATKNRGRGKIFNCFKPIADDDFDPASLPPYADEDAVRRKKRLRRSFSAALKAVLFKSSLLKKSRSENSKQDWDGSKSNLFSKSKKFVNSMKKNLPCKPPLGPEEIFRTNSDRSSIFSSNLSSRTPSMASSSSVSSCSSHSRTGSDKLGRSSSLDFRHTIQQKPVRRRDQCGRKSFNNILVLEMCVFLICLGALVWGKVFAIAVCTCAWLFFAPASRRQQPPQRIQRLESFDVTESEEYKKRVIMEGILERNR